MSTLLRKLRLVSLVVATLIGHAWEWIAGLAVSRAEADRRSSTRLAEIENQTMESERLDRLRNPGDYRGR